MAETTRAEDDEVELRCRKEDGKEFLKKALFSAKKLDLGHGGISALPSEIGAFVNLKMLDLSGNRLASLPPEIGLLANLQQLWAGLNRLIELPKEIGLLSRLSQLYLHGNQLTTLPPEICRLSNLTELLLSENAFVDPRLHKIAVRGKDGYPANAAGEVLVLMATKTRFLCCDHDFRKAFASGVCEACSGKFKGIVKRAMVCSKCNCSVHDECVSTAAEMAREHIKRTAELEQFLKEPRRFHIASEKREEHFQEPPARAIVSDHSVARSTAPPTSQSSVADVCNWLGTIGLGALAKTFVNNDISGAVLLELSETDLEKMGVSSLGQRKTLLSALRSLQQAAPSPAAPLSPAASALTERAAAARAPPPPRSAKFVAPESESVTYKGLLELPDSYKPQGTCAQELLAARAVLGSKVPQLELIVKEVGSVSWSILAGQTAQELVKTHGLTEQEVFAIVAYTYDLGLSGAQSENLYFQLNELLRRRVADEMRAVMGFLYFILGALRKLPAFEGTVFRGNNSPGMVASEYTTGREIFWSGFTSTTTDLAAALDFAGRDGVVFRIKINSGRSIAKLSVMQRENEVLLPPNACLIAFSEMHREADGVQYVDLVEKKDSFRW